MSNSIDRGWIYSCLDNNEGFWSLCGSKTRSLYLRNMLSWVGVGDNRAAMELCFGHITEKNLAYFGVFGSFRNFIRHKICPPHPNHFLIILWEIHFFNAVFWDKMLVEPKRL